MMACCCSSPDCLLNGCRIARCERERLGTYQAPRQGCICPPTSEQTCQNPLCPRKAIPSAASIGAQP